MSYAEHGPRIFFSGISNTGLTFPNGDYVPMRKRSEGRLKLHDSCSDIRAWSLNSMESSQYFRELTEHVSLSGSIIPINVVIDHIIGLTSKAQNELRLCKNELQKYKALRLTEKQQEQLKKLDKKYLKADQQGLDGDQSGISLFRNGFFQKNQSVSPLHLYPQLSIHFRPESSKNNKTITLPSSNTNNGVIDNLPSTRRNFHQDLPPKSISNGEYVNVALQVVQDVRDIGIQYKVIEGSLETIKSQPSLVYQYSNEESDVKQETESPISETDRSLEYDSSDGQASQVTESQLDFTNESRTESNSESTETGHKEVIIQKDSEIIVLKNDLYVKEAELEELRDLNNNLENLLRTKDENLTHLQASLRACHDELLRIEQHHNYEVQDLKERISAYSRIIQQLEEDLNRKDQHYKNLQAKEMEKFQSYVDEVVILRGEKQALLTRLKELEEKSKEVKNYEAILEQLKRALKEEEELKKETQEQRFILAEEEEEIKRLMTLIKQICTKCSQQKKMEQVIKDLKIAIQCKDVKISRYEEHMIAMRREVSEFFSHLKKCLDNFDELNQMCDDSHTSMQSNFDVKEEAENIFYSINAIMIRFQNFKIERQKLLREIEDLKHNLELYKSQWSSELQTRLNIQEHDGVVVLKLNENESSLFTAQEQIHTSGSEEDYVSAFIDSDVSLPKWKETETNSSATQTVPEKCDKATMENMEEFEKEITEHVSESLLKIRTLMQELQEYAECERPVLIKQMQHFQDILKNVELAMNNPQGMDIAREQISKVHDELREDSEMSELNMEMIPDKIKEIQSSMCKSIESILCKLLEKLSSCEEESATEKQIDGTINSYLISCIDKLNGIVEGSIIACNKHLVLKDTVESQGRIIKENEEKISGLTEQVSKYEEQILEHNRLSTEHIKQEEIIRDQLLTTASELSTKEISLTKLEEDLRCAERKLFASNKDCFTLKKQNRNLENAKNRLEKEIQSKIEEINNQTRRIRNLQSAADNVITLKDQISKMENRLCSLQFENDDLRGRISKVNEITSAKDKIITDLKNSIKEQNETISCKIKHYNETVGEKQSEIMYLKSENELLNSKLNDREGELTKMDKRFQILSEEKEKVDLLHVLHTDLEELTRSERKLKLHLSTLKTVYLNDQGRNKKLESKLDSYQHQNEILQKDIEYWKHENSQLLQKWQEKNLDKDTKKLICSLTNGLFEKISNLKERLHSVEEETDDSIVCEKTVQVVEKGSTNLINPEKIRKSEFDSDFKIKRLCQPLRIAIWNKNEEINELKGDIRNLLNDVQSRDCEIKALKESMNLLLQEKAQLQNMLQCQLEEYQSKLTVMKKNYDSSVHALSVKHEESIMRLQMGFQDTIISEKDPFESLGIKGLIELHNKICVSNSCIIKNKDFDAISIENNIMHEIGDVERIKSQIIILRNDGTTGDVLLNENLQRDIKNRWYFTAENEQKYLKAKQCNEDILHNSISTSGNTMSLEQDKKMDQKKNIRLIEMEECKKPPRANEKENDDCSDASKTLDEQRWNFISRCSMHLKSGNTYQHT